MTKDNHFLITILGDHYRYRIMISKKSNKSTTKAAKSIKAAFKSAKRQALDDIAQKMHDAKAENGGKLPHNYIPTILAEMKAMCP